LDFGIATILQPSAGDDNNAQMNEKWAMTPESASPEQISKQTISTRSDVYALGVLLYRMLADQSPYHSFLRDLTSLQKAILEYQPVPPSEVISQPQLKKSVAGDLDAIVIKALSKDPQERYASATAMADDVRNYLRKLPVKARPQSIGYLSYKLLLRYPKTLLGSALAASVFVMTVLFYSYQVAQQRDLAQQRLATAEQISDFMVDVFSISDPEEALGNTITAREILDQGALKIETTLANQPDVQYALRHTLGKVYLSLGLKQPAKAMLEKERAYRMANRTSDPQPLIDNSIAYASLLAYMGEPGQAREMLEDAVQLQARISGVNSLEMANVYMAKAKLSQLFGDFEEAKSLIEKTLKIQRQLLPEDSNETLRSELLKNVILSELGLFDEAIASSHGVIKKAENLLGERHPIVSEGYRDLGFYLKLTGRYGEAKQALLKALAIDKAIYGDEHYTIALDLYELGSLLSFTDQDKAISYLQQVLSLRENILSKYHWTRAVAHNDLANIFSDQSRFSESEYHYLQSLEINRATFGEVHPEVATNHTNLGLLYMDMKRFDDAQRHLDIGMSLRRQIYPESHPHIAASLSVMGSLRFAQEQYSDALDYYTQSLNMKLQFHKPESGMILAARGRIARALIMMHCFEDAEQTIAMILSDLPNSRELATREAKYIYSTMTELLKAPIPCTTMTRLYPIWLPIFADVLVDSKETLDALSNKYQQCQVE
jgi:serine/threonine-protein kinase